MSELKQLRQLQRLKYIDLCAYILGFVNRKVLMNRFDVKQACVTNDFNFYQKVAGDTLVYDHGLKAYKPVDWFSPTYEHAVNDAIDLISEGKQSIVCEPGFAANTYSYAIKSVQPELSKVFSIFRGLYLNKKVEMEYLSRSSGQSHRLIAPHSLIRTGCFTYVRAFDHKSGEFRSFKLNRIISSKLINSRPSDLESKLADLDWQSEVTVTLVINEGVDNPEAIEYDYGLNNGKLEITIKKALIMFFLMDWNIAPQDFSELPVKLYPLRVKSIEDLNVNQ